MTTRIGHGVAAPCLFFLLPFVVAVAAVVSSLLRPDADRPEPTCRPDRAA